MMAPKSLLVQAKDIAARYYEPTLIDYLGKLDSQTKNVDEKIICWLLPAAVDKHIPFRRLEYMFGEELVEVLEAIVSLEPDYYPLAMSVLDLIAKQEFLTC